MPVFGVTEGAVNLAKVLLVVFFMIMGGIDIYACTPKVLLLNICHSCDGS